MRQIVHSSQFKRDYRTRSREKGLDGLLSEVIGRLAPGDPLPAKLRDHPLKGGYAGCRECHLKPDLLLIYVLTQEELRLIQRDPAEILMSLP